MLFVVQFLRDAIRRSQPHIIRTVTFESDDLFSVVSRIRIILSSSDYQPAVDAFQIIANGTQVIYHERRSGCGVEQSSRPDDARPSLQENREPATGR